jgi:transposase
MSSIRPNRVEVVTSVQLRRRWTPEQKLEIVKQTNEPGSSVSLVARQHLIIFLNSKSLKIKI